MATAPTSNRIALNALWIALPQYAHPFDEWVEQVYADGWEWEAIAEEVRKQTMCPIAPDGWEPSRPTLTGWYPHLRRRVPSEYAQPTGDAA